MIKAILGQKQEMTRFFNKEGKAIPVTVIQAGPCYVIQVKNKEKDGYDAIVIGYGQIKKLKKPQEDYFKKIGIKEKLKYLREFEVKEKTDLKPGDKIDVSVFKEGDKVTVSGISKGKGFAGVIKRWGFARGPETHGSDHHRHPGSIGSMFPQRVLKGKKMPGRMGGERVTTKGLEIIEVSPQTNTLIIKGTVPGFRKGILEIRG